MYVCKYAYAPIFRGRLLADRRRASVPPCSQQLKLITREQLATGNWQHTGRPATPTPTIRIIQQQQQRRKAKQEKAKAKTKKNPHTNKSKKRQRRQQSDNGNEPQHFTNNNNNSRCYNTNNNGGNRNNRHSTVKCLACGPGKKQRGKYIFPIHISRAHTERNMMDSGLCNTLECNHLYLFWNF